MPCYTEKQRDKKDDFVALIDVISAGLISNRPDILYLIGDRLEAYAGALAAHFLRIPVAHFAGGQITKGLLTISTATTFPISHLFTSLPISMRMSDFSRYLS